MDNLIEVGLISKPHGINGQVKIKSLAFGNFDFKNAKVLFIDKIPYEVENIFQNKDEFVCKFKEISSVENALRLKSKSVCAKRENVQKNKDDYFWQDLIGLNVVDNLGNNLGRVEDIQNFKSADVFYIKGKKPFLFSNKGGIIESVSDGTIVLNKQALEEVICYEN